MGGTGSFEGIEGTVDVVTITGSTGPIPLVESPNYDSTGPNYPLESPISYDSYHNRTLITGGILCGILSELKITDVANIAFLMKNERSMKDAWQVNQLHKLTYLHGRQLNKEPVQLGFVSFGKTVLKIVVKSNIPLPVAP